MFSSTFIFFHVPKKILHIGSITKNLINRRFVSLLMLLLSKLLIEYEIFFKLTCCFRKAAYFSSRDKQQRHSYLLWLEDWF